MFSPEASALSARGSLRNPRRRQRKDSDGPQQPRRKRSKLSNDTFQLTNDAHAHARVNGNGNGKGSLKMNGYAHHQEDSPPNATIDIPVREKKEPPKRGVKSDTALYLTKNENYTVKRLPSFPSNLLRGPVPFQASALPSAGLALALTYNSAILWDYTTVSGPSKVVTLPLPFGLKDSESLPLGAIVRNGPTNEYGILAVAPSSGKITFWENVESAEARSHFPQRHNGVDGAVKLYSGETIVKLVDVKHAGYVLVFSSGRLAQLTLRDPQGRPSISVGMMNSPSASNGSFFSFKGLLGGAIRRTIVSVQAHASERGQMDVISATGNGLFQLWDLNFTGQQQNFNQEIDVHAEMLAAVQQGSAPETRAQQEVHILDFAIMNKENASGAFSLLVLVALSGRNLLDYSLLEVDLSDNCGTVSRAIPIRTFHQTQMPKEATGTLLLPLPGHTAFVQFPGAISVVSLAKPEVSPESQLLSDSGEPILPFQDTVYFREDRNVHVCGHALEYVGKKDKLASILVFVQDFGVVQITAQPPAKTTELIDRCKVTAKSKLYQATFFSKVPGNILDFSIKSRFAFSQSEVESAAITISLATIKSEIEFFEKVPTSMDDHIGQRAFALRSLITLLRLDYPPISPKIAWRLLWNAEKLAAASELWKWYQAKLHDKEARPEAYPESLLLNDMVKAVSDKFKTKIDTALGETDPVRQFFLRDLGSLEILLLWAFQYLRLVYLKDDSKTKPAVLQRISEGNDVFLIALETAFAFREEHVAFYGLDPDSIEGGLLKPGHGYDLLPHFWTSTHNIVANLRSIIDVGRKVSLETYEQNVQEELAQKVAKDNPRLVKLGCQTTIERYRWCLEQSDEQKIEAGKALRAEFETKVRPDHIYKLVGIGLAYEGMNLAEYYHDMPTLVRLIWDETTYLEENRASTQSKMELAEIMVKLNRIRDRIHRCFETYGDAWAEAFYSQYINENQSGQLLMNEHLNQPALTKFLRADPSRARLRWINEVNGERNYDGAAEALLTASKQETNSWCFKVEMSIAKLALLCKHQETPSDELERAPKETPKESTLAENKLRAVKCQLEFAKIQDRVYERLLPTIAGALDNDSAVQLLMAEFGQGRLTDRPGHQQLLQQGFEELIHNRVLDPALLVDVLTLMTYDETVPPTEIIQSNEFAFALKVISLSYRTLHKTSQSSLVKLVWKRLLLKDDWASINDTKNVPDEQLQEMLAHTTAGWTWKAFQKMLEDDKLNRLVAPPPKVVDLVGAGCTHGELCIRFASEDIRTRIIADNVADDTMLQDMIKKHRLEGWFVGACNAGRKAYEEEKNPGLHSESQVLAIEGNESDDVCGEEPGPEQNNALVIPSVEEQSMVVVAVGEDVEMQDR
ncbi:hypothetical protein K504DRAFT_467140 [Pleomassaria siparia CBS 279.74]|uniref:Nucleoporin-domain-containing protein n=1 Tax=Pleomassaria siparia CBS 279.74 TaxID=1314801 RepID=A0A6G1K9L9_9PLEO|nr:hypothetical protein K504DRAFT_467140 [Pleomassaria siparia CBS 279.74]